MAPFSWVDLLSGPETLPSRGPAAAAVLRDFFSGKLDAESLKAFLLCLAKRGETAAELSAAVRLMDRLEKRYAPVSADVLDVCGTGGDGQNTFNISSVAAFVIAGAGGRVAKHGNRAVSSKCGSSDLMESLGVNLEARPARMLAALRQCGMGYFHAPLYHPLFAKVQALRREWSVRTLFNLMGPFLNPVRIRRQMIGCGRSGLPELFAQVLKARKLQRALVFHSRDGLDEFSTAAASDIVELNQGRIRRWTLAPRTLGLPIARRGAYAGGGPQENKKIAMDLLRGRLKGPARDVVLLNAAAGLYTGGQARNLHEGLQRARAALEQKQALAVLQTLIRISNS